jgi:hypothetical protein
MAIAVLEGRTATPLGLLKFELMPLPSPAPGKPQAPPSDVTTPRSVTARMQFLPVSATIIKPVEGTTATPAGLMKLLPPLGEAPAQNPVRL